MMRRDIAVWIAIGSLFAVAAAAFQPPCQVPPIAPPVSDWSNG